ncbi:translation initiation factor eIF-2B subunit epsilon [Encephalitozoon intestinalis ATCC 50506]|uniref:Translation initiation factor eIF-2B subunit epsilon n=1 Tax=Encephalitozoon intestinalis (strain ATCC 50506) TaxID=876142 RepID=E0S9K6_ENCIT|nr:translation initiation factor eIF-2B subunit epsilon [Encephalitozoon intestinalis ATCC 50506]ADM12391.1 translation initiation factor eIF-2B subunit epsilon [Encephalitozoon intestinalis ATCC 50506]UTX46223.1 putative translation initiation factor EIF-2B subunit epsilon [Encephalitozoon intestinalis]
MEIRDIKNFIRENREIILLICDFYETKQIPAEMTSLRKNLSLFPVANIPMIEYILSSLCDQKFFNVVLAGSDCEEVIKHVKKTELGGRMNIISLGCDGKSLGDLMRHIDDNGLEFDDLLVIYANHYTNYPLRSIINRHREDKSFVMTLFLHPNESNSRVSHLYGFRDNEVIFYNKCINEKCNSEKVREAVESDGTIEFTANLSSPTIAVVSSAIFPLFTENFDFKTLGDLVGGILGFNAYNFKIMCCRQGDMMDVNGNIEQLSIERRNRFYSREIVTLYDYFKFNEDVREGKAVDLLRFKCHNSGDFRSFVQVESNFFFDIPDVEFHEPISNTVIGCDLKFKMNHFIKNSVVGHGCFIGGNIDRCIIWDDISVKEDFMDHIVFSEGRVIHYNYLEDEAEEAVFEEKEPRRGTSFFDDVVLYLLSVVEREDLDRVDMDDVVKQITLLRIVRNASSLDLIEAFSMFLVEMIDFNDIDGSTIKASMFFSILDGHMREIEKQEMLMDLIIQGLGECPPDIKMNVVFKYGYLLVEDGIISRSVFKRYNSILKTWVLPSGS